MPLPQEIRMQILAFMHFFPCLKIESKRFIYVKTSEEAGKIVLEGNDWEI